METLRRSVNAAVHNGSGRGCREETVKVRVGCAVALVIVTLGLTGAATENPVGAADSRPYIQTPSADMFWCTSTQPLCTNEAIAHVPFGTRLNMLCWVDDREVWRNSPRRWIYAYLDNGQEGFFWQPQIGGVEPATPSCAPNPSCPWARYCSVNWITAANYAIGHLGQATYQSGDGSYIPRDNPSVPAPWHWSGFCTAFVYDAWEQWGGVPATSHAEAADVWDWFNRYQPAKVHREDAGVTRPPRGALVFWASPTRSLWHVAISIGNWQAIGTTHAASGPKVARYDVLTSGYTGWIMPQTPTVRLNPS